MKKQIYKHEIIEPQDFDKMIKKLRGFFMEQNYLESFPNIEKIEKF